MATSKLIVASARLPVSLSKAENHQWEVVPSPGGLATALRTVAAHRPFTWVGWPGTAVDPSEREEVTDTLQRHAQAHPLFFEEDEVEGFYERFSNRILWPLFHYHPGPKRFDRVAWEHYQTVNARYADQIAALAQPGDTIWVHDYQLLLVPQMLRDRGVDLAIGFFLHIPFPSSEVYRTLPVREAILQGMLGANLLGFHTYEYVSHFRASVLRILGIESEPENIALPTHNARLGVLPIGIDPVDIARMATTSASESRYQELCAQHQGQQVILGVDRLDYTKGLLQKLLAYEQLLKLHPHLVGRVVHIHVDRGVCPVFRCKTHCVDRSTMPRHEACPGRFPGSVDTRPIQTGKLRGISPGSGRARFPGGPYLWEKICPYRPRVTGCSG